jgi:hypothetical protein
MIAIIHKYLCKKRNVPFDRLFERNPKNGRLKRDRELVICRQLVVYYAMANGYSERESGAYFDNQDHATAHHAKTKIRGLCDIYRDFRFDVAEYDKALIGLRGLNDKEIQNKMEYNKQERIEYVNGAILECTNQITALQKRLGMLKSILKDIRI